MVAEAERLQIGERKQLVPDLGLLQAQHVRATMRTSRSSPPSRSRTELTFQLVMRRGKGQFQSRLPGVLPRVDKRHTKEGKMLGVAGRKLEAMTDCHGCDLGIADPRWPSVALRRRHETTAE